MTLKQLRDRPFDDILYQGNRGYLKSKQSLPAELFRTDERFLMKTFDLYCTIEEEHTTMLRQKSPKTGMTTALAFIIAYYSLNHPVITILERRGLNVKVLKPVFEMFAKFVNFNYQFDKKSTQILLRYENDVYCKINLLNSDAFDIADVSGLVLFNDCNKMKNSSKFRDLLANRGKYDKLIFNFPQSEEIDKLAADYNLKIKQIGILND